MRLINVRTVKLQEFFSNEIPPYAILSHTWGREEITFQDISTLSANPKRGYQKIQSACTFAESQGYEYIWIDTCCIDKKSSAELSEAINSMCSWYQASSICYAYLVDVKKLAFEVTFYQSRWWTRGWTLQELLAPKDVIFLDSDWQVIGSKQDPQLQMAISHITGIAISSLTSLSVAQSQSVAERMSWASSRSTTRVEDKAYSLLGLFDVNMPLLYGEGSKAFIRLQEEILKTSTDQSIFAWGLAVDTEELPRPHDISSKENNPTAQHKDPLARVESTARSDALATSPQYFERSHGIRPMFPPYESTPFRLNNLGIQIELAIVEPLLATTNIKKAGQCVALLACKHDSQPRDFLGIILRRLNNDQRYVRLHGQTATLSEITQSTFTFKEHQVLGAVSRDICLIRKSGDSSQLPYRIRNGLLGLRSRKSSLAVRISPDLQSEGWKIINVHVDGHSLPFHTIDQPGSFEPAYKLELREQSYDQRPYIYLLSFQTPSTTFTVTLEATPLLPKNSIWKLNVHPSDRLGLNSPNLRIPGSATIETQLWDSDLQRMYDTKVEFCFKVHHILYKQFFVLTVAEYLGDPDVILDDDPDVNIDD